VSPDTWPDRHALLELQALLTQIAALRSEGDAVRFTADSRYRWILHRLWIAAGNEALAFTQATGQPVRADKTWAYLYDLRNHLAHLPAPRHRRRTHPPLHLGPPRLPPGHHPAPPANTTLAKRPVPAWPPTDHHPPAAAPGASRPLRYAK
jgi:hypothetical protein